MWLGSTRGRSQAFAIQPIGSLALVHIVPAAGSNNPSGPLCTGSLNVLLENPPPQMFSGHVGIIVWMYSVPPDTAG